jgi:polyphosphate kinase 2 (PPK2 family)
LEERLQNPQKFRKHNDNDRESRKKRDEYTETYEQIFNNCTVTPRHIIPSDKNRWKVHQIAQIIVSEFEKMDLKRPGLETEKFD